MFEVWGMGGCKRPSRATTQHHVVGALCECDKCSERTAVKRSGAVHAVGVLQVYWEQEGELWGDMGRTSRRTGEDECGFTRKTTCVRPGKLKREEQGSRRY